MERRDEKKIQMTVRYPIRGVFRDSLLGFQENKNVMEP